MRANLVDILAVSFFILEWAAVAITLEHTAYGRDSLSARMNVYREVWVRRMLEREARMVDMKIMASLQNGTAFFASTSLLAVGGALALLRSTNARFHATGQPARHPASRGACDANDEIVRGGGQAFQSRAARLLLCAWLSRLVRQSVGLVRNDGRSGGRHVAQAVRLQRLARDGKLILNPISAQNHNR